MKVLCFKYTLLSTLQHAQRCTSFFGESSKLGKTSAKHQVLKSTFGAVHANQYSFVDVPTLDRGFIQVNSRWGIGYHGNQVDHVSTLLLWASLGGCGTWADSNHKRHLCQVWGIYQVEFIKRVWRRRKNFGNKWKCWINHSGFVYLQVCFHFCFVSLSHFAIHFACHVEQSKVVHLLTRHDTQD